VMYYLSHMDENQTLSMYSGHPMGLFPSSPSAPRVVITNGMTIPNYSQPADYDRYYGLGTSMYGQMTAGSYCYIGPQGIVHGTTLVVLNASRKYLGSSNLAGKVFLTSGLGGMSGAQAKAAVIAGCIGIVAEVSSDAVHKRHQQGWVQEIYEDQQALWERVRELKAKGESRSLAYLGNVVDLWEHLAAEGAKSSEVLVELGSDQTSLHNPFNGGYYPVGYSFDAAQELMARDEVAFKAAVESSLKRQAAAINFLTTHKQLHFWDYGNAFLLQASRAGADILDASKPSGFRYPSYVEDIMGDIFSLGFGPFRWVCTSGEAADLDLTDQLALSVLDSVKESASHSASQQYEDNITWIKHAKDNKMVVGSQARILYSDALGRQQIALAFNKAVNEGKLKGPVVISRDHHDVSGTDSPFRETSNIRDGSKFLADMAVQNVIGDAMRGATYVALHNGGGVGWGEVMNGGFGLVLDGSDVQGQKASDMLFWDVNNGVARRAWAQNDNALESIELAMQANPLLKVTVAVRAEDSLLDSIIPQ
jgi:urocanate hydratase